MTYQTPPLVKHLYSLGVCPLSAPPGPLDNCYSVLMDDLSFIIQVQTVTYQTPPLVKHLYSLGVCPLSAPPGPQDNCYSVLIDDLSFILNRCRE